MNKMKTIIATLLFTATAALAQDSQNLPFQGS